MRPLRRSSVALGLAAALTAGTALAQQPAAPQPAAAQPAAPQPAARLRQADANMSSLGFLDERGE